MPTSPTTQPEPSGTWSFGGRKLHTRRIARMVLEGVRTFQAAVRHFQEDHAGIRAAAIAYYGLVAFFPFMALALVGGSLLLRDPRHSHELVHALRAYVPFIDPQFLGQATEAADERLDAMRKHSGAFLIGGIAVLLLLSSRVWVAMDLALHVIFRTARPPRRPWTVAIFLRLRGMTATLLIMACLAAWFVVRGVLRGIEAAAPRLPDWVGSLLHDVLPARLLIPASLVGLVAYIIFRNVPGAHVRHRPALFGALMFVGGHELMLWVFGTFVVAVSRASLAYGSFLGLMSLVVWVFWQACLLLYCAEVVALLTGSRRMTHGSETLDTPAIGDDTQIVGTESPDRAHSVASDNVNPSREGGDPNES